jgi:hypothetical protein
LTALFATTVADPPHTERSKGYAGSLPDGQFPALATGDCRMLQGQRRLATLLVPIFSDCRERIPSPDGEFELRTREGEGIEIDVVERSSGRVLSRAVTAVSQPVMMMWRPSSDGFFLNDGEGSGQTSRFRYFHRSGGTWRESKRFDAAAVRFFLRRQRCRPGAYANVSGMGWTRAGEVKAVVQEGLHSEGCLQPEDGNIALEMAGDPWTGRLRLVKVRVDR